MKENLINNTKEIYIRDAQGNVLAVYEQKLQGNTMSIKQAETHIYGTQRLGISYPSIEMIGNSGLHTDSTKYYYGHKDYELTNHLGNVLATVSDRKIPVDKDNDAIIDNYVADITSVSDYYPFGSPLYGRRWSAKYRYGFNDKENINEVYGIGNFQDYGARMYDTRLARFISPDPIIVMQHKYQDLSPYQFASNTPIQAIDLDGMEGFQYLEIMKMKNGTTVTKRIVEVDIYVATSKNANSIHYKSADLSTIQSNLQSEYNKGFKDAAGNEVEFRFNVKEFDADQVSPSDKVKQLRQDPNNWVKTKDNGMAPKGFVMERGKLENSVHQGKTINAHTIISATADDPSHTQAHEVGHIFLNYDMSINPSKQEEHNKLGGIFKYKVIDGNTGKTIQSTEKVNQNNVNLMLKVLPELSTKTIEEK
ncbi:MAG: RHS repeat-associated core domain-containing protein [Bacteroidota bacterium]